MGKTSTQVKQRYLDKAYSQIAVRLQKDLVAQWEEAIKADGISKAIPFRKIGHTKAAWSLRSRRLLCK